MENIEYERNFVLRFEKCELKAYVPMLEGKAVTKG